MCNQLIALLLRLTFKAAVSAKFLFLVILCILAESSALLRLSCEHFETFYVLTKFEIASQSTVYDNKSVQYSILLHVQKQ